MPQPAAAPPLGAYVFQALFAGTDEGMCVVRVIFGDGGAAVDYEFLIVNASFQRITGLPDVSGARMSELPMEQQPSHWLGMLGEVARDGHMLRLSDFSPRLGRWFEGHVIRIAGPEHHLVAVRYSDITEQRRVHERLASIYHITTLGVMFWGEGFDLKDVNEGFLQMTGFTRGEAIGKTWEELTPPEYHELSRNAVREVTTLGETMPYEKEYFRKDGSRWWGLFAARKVGDEVVELVLDVNERWLSKKPYAIRTGAN